MPDKTMTAKETIEQFGAALRNDLAGTRAAYNQRKTKFVEGLENDDLSTPIGWYAQGIAFSERWMRLLRPVLEFAEEAESPLVLVTRLREWRDDVVHRALMIGPSVQSTSWSSNTVSLGQYEADQKFAATIAGEDLSALSCAFQQLYKLTDEDLASLDVPAEEVA